MSGFDPNQPRGHTTNSGRWTARDHSAPEMRLAPAQGGTVEYRDGLDPAATHGGYDTIHRVREAGRVTTFTYLNGMLHNTAGPAVDGGDRIEHWLHGEQILAPEPDCRLMMVAPGGVTVWRAGDDARTVTIHRDGTQVFERDGDLNRLGGPAVVYPDDRPDEWWLAGTRVPSPEPDQPLIERAGEGDRGYVTTTGSRHQPDRKLRSIARDIEKDLAHAIRMGYLPTYGPRVAVSTARPRGGPAELTLTVTGLDEAEIHRPEGGWTEQAADIHAKLAGIAEAYNTSTTEVSGDYHRSDFLVWVNFQPKETW